jgi:hypothetical protein
MTAQAPTTPAGQVSPAVPVSLSGLPALRLLFARRARPKAAGPTRTASRAEEAVPSTPDVWLACLRLGG